MEISNFISCVDIIANLITVISLDERWIGTHINFDNKTTNETNSEMS